MKLVLYSGGDNTLNEKLDRELIKLSGSHTPTMVYIPHHPLESSRHFKQFCSYYRNYGVKNFQSFPLPFSSTSGVKKITAQQRQLLMKSDIIYLSGGNTYLFLHYLRKSGMLTFLKQFLKKGGVLAGSSAGGIIMTPNIDTAAIPSRDCDENTLNLKNLLGLNLIPFEFSPHYESCPVMDRELRLHSLQTPYPILCCEDGAGLVIQDKKLTIIGSVVRFQGGRKTVIRSKKFTPRKKLSHANKSF